MNLKEREKDTQKLFKRKFNRVECGFSTASSQPLLSHKASFQNCETALTSSEAFPGIL